MLRVVRSDDEASDLIVRVLNVIVEVPNLIFGVKSRINEVPSFVFRDFNSTFPGSDLDHSSSEEHISSLKLDSWNFQI